MPASVWFSCASVRSMLSSCFIKAAETRKKEAADLRKQVSAAEALKKDPAQLAELKRRRQASQRDPAEVKAAEEVLAQVDNLKKKIPEIDADTKLLEESVQDLTVELQKMRDPQPANKIVSGGSGRDLSPTFIECATNEVVLHHRKPPTRIELKDLARNEPFKQIVKRVAGQEKSTIVFLVRQDGADSFYAARRLADAEGARNGKLPLVGSGEVDLSFFSKN